MSGTATRERPRGPGTPRRRRDIAQARRRRNRLLPLLVVAAASFVAGVVIAAGSPEKETAERFVTAWTKQDFVAMHDELSDSSASEHPLEDLRNAYLAAQNTATASAINPGDVNGPSETGGRKIVTVDVAIRTKLFGVIDGTLELPYEGDKIAWDPYLTFPGLVEGERLGRRLEVGERAAILARDGTPLAQGQGADRTSPLGSDAIDVAGEIGKPDAEQVAELVKQGYPSDIEVGISGLERSFNSRLGGVPGGELLAVKGEGGDVPASTPGRTLASAQSKPGEPLKTTIDPGLQKAAVASLAGRFGGAVVLDARSGAVRAMAGGAYSQPAPPGSTFKLITTTAALEEKAVKLSDEFDVVQSVNIGREIENSNGELCGGTFVEAFAHSCNTVFAPLGIKVGEQKLVATAEDYGFNHEPELFNEEATEAIDPPMPEIPVDVGDDLDVGVTAIGQGRVLATPLVMASVAQTIAAGGVRSPTPLVTDPDLGPEAKPVQVTSPEIAGVIRNLMVEVVNNGTGVNASIPGVQVAGKTGTAELGPKPASEQPPQPKELAPGEEPPKPEQILDAWFTAFAPAQKPKLVATVFFADSDGDGGEVAAPAVRGILESALGR